MLQAARFAQNHQNLIFDAARSVGRQLDILFGIEGIDRLDQSDRADGNQILDADTGIFKLARNVNHQTKVAFDYRTARFAVACANPADHVHLLIVRKRRWQTIAAADVAYGTLAQLHKKAVDGLSDGKNRHLKTPFFKNSG